MSTPVEPVAPGQTAGTPSTDPPLTLWNDVVGARSRFAQQRQGPQSSPADVADARADLLSSLEAYVDSLDQRRLPVPYALRDELRIHQLTRPAGPTRRARSRLSGGGR